MLLGYAAGVFCASFSGTIFLNCLRHELDLSQVSGVAVWTGHVTWFTKTMQARDKSVMVFC
jgi:hypothetical protein